MVRTARLRWTAIGMTALSGAVGWHFGSLAAFMYPGRLEPLGVILGAAAGVAVGVGWCRLMIRAGDRAAHRGRSGKLIFAPVVGGIGAGCVATVVLHLGMQLVHGSEEGLMKHLIGQAFGLVAGFVAGVVGGLVWPPVPQAPAIPEAARQGGDAGRIEK